MSSMMTTGASSQVFAPTSISQTWQKKLMENNLHAVSVLQSRLERLQRIASKYIALAREREIDITESLTGLAKSISCSPDINEHQLLEIKYLHLVKIFERCCNEMSSRVNRSYFTKVNPVVALDLKWNLQQLVIMAFEYMEIAEKEEVNIQPQIKNMVETIVNAPSFDDPHQSKELIYRQQLLLRGAYCSQIIRKVTEHRILRTAAAARKMPKFAKQIPWINANEKWLLDRLPKEELSFIKHPEIVKRECQWLESKLEDMKEKML